MKFLIPIALVAFLFASCGEEQSTENEQQSTRNYRVEGEKIANLSQKTLLSNVQREMKAGGPENAIKFCSTNAWKIMDSLSETHGVYISRVSEKNRNPVNKANEFERSLLNALETSKTGDTVVVKGDRTTYYKSIRIAKPACLKCHGVPGKDINEKTLAILHKRYPKDNATGYSINDFRGAWKIEFE